MKPFFGIGTVIKALQIVSNGNGNRMSDSVSIKGTLRNKLNVGVPKPNLTV